MRRQVIELRADPIYHRIGRGGPLDTFPSMGDKVGSGGEGGIRTMASP